MLSGPCLISVVTLTYTKVICVGHLLQSSHCCCPYTLFLAQKSPLFCFHFQQNVGKGEDQAQTQRTLKIIFCLQMQVQEDMKLMGLIKISHISNVFQGLWADH